MSENQKITLNGWISDHWEQGMEQMPIWIFQDREYSRNRIEGWKYEGMYILSEGYYLTILDDNDRVLWEGYLKARKTGFLCHKKIFPDNYEWCPDGVLLETWKSWFKRKPPLRAILTLNGNRQN